MRERAGAFPPGRRIPSSLQTGADADADADAHIVQWEKIRDPQKLSSNLLSA